MYYSHETILFTVHDIMFFHLNLSVDGKKPRSSISSPPQLSPTGTSQELSSYWTPSLSVGLSTPPSSQRNTPATSVLENSLASIHQALPGTTEHAENQSTTIKGPKFFAIASGKKDWVWYFLNVRIVLWNYICMCARTYLLRMCILQNIDRFLGTSANTSTTATPRATPPISSEDEKVQRAFQFLWPPSVFGKERSYFFYLSIWQSVDQMLSTQCLYPLLGGCGF